MFWPPDEGQPQWVTQCWVGNATNNSISVLICRSSIIASHSCTITTTNGLMRYCIHSKFLFPLDSGTFSLMRESWNSGDMSSRWAQRTWQENSNGRPILTSLIMTTNAFHWVKTMHRLLVKILRRLVSVLVSSMVWFGKVFITIKRNLINIRSTPMLLWAQFAIKIPMEMV